MHDDKSCFIWLSCDFVSFVELGLIIILEIICLFKCLAKIYASFFSFSQPDSLLDNHVTGLNLP